MPERMVTRGVVLRRTETKEADYILTVLTAELGRLTVIARGARRAKSRLTAACELFAFSELVLYRRGEWTYLDEAATVSLFDGVRRDVERLALASYLAELTESVTAEDLPGGEALTLLLNMLYALDALPDRDPELIRAVFELRLLSRVGYEPLVSACAVCGATAPLSPLFDPREGVVMCAACAGDAKRELLPLDPGSLAAMRHVTLCEGKRLLSFRLAGESMRRFSRACERFTAAQLDRRFRTLDFYKSLKTDNDA